MHSKKEKNWIDNLKRTVYNYNIAWHSTTTNPHFWCFLEKAPEVLMASQTLKRSNMISSISSKRKTLWIFQRWKNVSSKTPNRQNYVSSKTGLECQRSHVLHSHLSLIYLLFEWNKRFVSTEAKGKQMEFIYNRREKKLLFEHWHV